MIEQKMKLSVIAGVLSAALSGCSTFHETKLFKEASSDVSKEIAALKTEDNSRLRSVSLTKEIAAQAVPQGGFDLPKPTRNNVAKRFDLKAQNASASGIYQGIVEGAGMTAAVSPAIADKKISVALKDVTLEEALDVIREMYGFEYRIEGRRVYVSQPELTSSVIKLDYLVGARNGQSDLRVSSGSVSDAPQGQSSSTSSSTTTTAGGGQSQVNMSRVTTKESSDLWSNLEKTLGFIIKGDGRAVVVDPPSGTIFLKALPKELREAEKYVKTVEKSVSRQVMLEAKIIQVTLNDSMQTGINWASMDKNGNTRWSMNANTDNTGLVGSGLTPTTLTGASTGLFKSFPISGALGLAFQTGSFASLISFLETQGNVHVLSSPRIATLNNQKAVLKVGSDEFFVTNVSSTTTTSSGGGSSSTPNVTVAPFFSGVALDVTPQISDTGGVILRVHPQVSKVEEKSKTVTLGSLGSIVMPLASSSVSETDSVVRLINGNIVAIGGLMGSEATASKSQIPGLGNVPIAGEAFKQSSGAGKKTELVILIKPTVIETASDWAHTGSLGISK